MESRKELRGRRKMLRMTVEMVRFEENSACSVHLSQRAQRALFINSSKNMTINTYRQQVTMDMNTFVH